MQDIVSVVDLVKRYGGMIALDHFTMKIERGEIFGLAAREAGHQSRG